MKFKKISHLLQTDIDNSQNVFELNYDVKHGDDEKDNYGISITKTTIINGNGHTIDANGHGSIFVVKDSSVTLTLNDLTLINANPVSDSSGIVSNGGAVYFDGSTLIVNNVNSPKTILSINMVVQFTLLELVV